MKTKIRTTIIIIITMLAFGACFYYLGNTKLPLFSVSTDFIEPAYTSIDKENNLIALTDDHLQRVSIFNDNQQTKHSVSFSPLSTQSDIYLNIAEEKDITYIVHEQYDNNSGYIIKEEILAIKEDQHDQCVVYEQDYSAFADHIKSSRITDLRVENNTLYFTKKSAQNKKELQTLKVDNIYNFATNNENMKPNPILIQSANLPFSEEGINEAKYNPYCDKTVFTSFFGAVYQISDFNKLECVSQPTPEISFYGVCVDNESNIYATNDVTYQIYKLNKGNHDLIDIDVDANYINILNNNLVVSDSLTNSVKIYDTSTMQEIKSVNSMHYCTNLLVYSLLSSLSVLYICILLLILVIKGLLFFKNKSQPQTKKIVAIIAASTIIILSICIAFVYINYTQIKNMKKESLETLCYQISQTNTEYLEKANDDLLNGEQKNTLYDSLISNLESYYYSYAIGDGTYIEFNILPNQKLESYLKSFNINNNVLNLNNTQDLECLNLLITSEINNKDITINKLHYRSDGKIEVFSGEFTNAQGLQIYAATPIYSLTGNLTGFICVTSPIVQLIARQSQIGLEMFIAILVILCALSFAIIELIAQLKSAKKVRKIKKGDITGKTQICGARTLYFFPSFLECFDTAFCVLVTQDILSAQSNEYSEILLGLPLSICYIGSIIGSFISKALMKRIPLRKIQIIYCIISSFAFLLSVIAVIGSDFILFCISKFLTGMFQYTMSKIYENLIYQTSNPNKQKDIAYDFSLATVSASAIGGMIAGYISQYIGNYAIYASSILICFIALILAIYYIPKNVYIQNPTYKKNKNSSFKSIISQIKSAKNNNTLKFLLSPPMLAVLLILIFCTILGLRYSSILFPLISENNGIDNSQIGNINMIAVFIVFIIDNCCKKYLKKLNLRLVATLALLIIGVSLCYFFINSSMVWVIFTLFLIQYAYRLSTTSYRIIWIPHANKRRADKHNLTFFILMARDISAITTPLIISALLYFGQVQTCVILGTICCVSSIIFWIATKKFNAK